MLQRNSPTAISQNFSTNFGTFLKLHNQENDFISLASGLMEKKIDTDNIAWQSALHRGKFTSCGTTCNMKYDTGYVEFFSLFYLLFGASALSVLRGPGHFGSVVSQTNQKSCYSGENAMCNIPIPDVTILRKFDSGFEKVTPTGIIEKTP